MYSPGQTVELPGQSRWPRRLFVSVTMPCSVARVWVSSRAAAIMISSAGSGDEQTGSKQPRLLIAMLPSLLPPPVAPER